MFARSSTVHQYSVKLLHYCAIASGYVCNARRVPPINFMVGKECTFPQVSPSMPHEANTCPWPSTPVSWKSRASSVKQSSSFQQWRHSSPRALADETHHVALELQASELELGSSTYEPNKLFLCHKAAISVVGLKRELLKQWKGSEFAISLKEISSEWIWKNFRPQERA